MFRLNDWRVTRAGFVELPRCLEFISLDAGLSDEDWRLLMCGTRELRDDGIAIAHALVLAYLIGFTANERLI